MKKLAESRFLGTVRINDIGMAFYFQSIALTPFLNVVSRHTVKNYLKQATSMHLIFLYLLLPTLIVAQILSCLQNRRIFFCVFTSR
jgi:hypothetical protein